MRRVEAEAKVDTERSRDGPFNQIRHGLNKEGKREGIPLSEEWLALGCSSRFKLGDVNGCQPEGSRSGGGLIQLGHSVNQTQTTALNTPRKNILYGHRNHTECKCRYKCRNSHEELAKLGYIMYLLACLNYPS